MLTNDTVLSKNPVPPLVKVGEVAKLLALSRTSVKGLIESGDLSASPLHPARRKRKRVHVRITRESLAAFYKKRFGHHLNRALLNPFQS